ncbi:hypothetical protein [Paramagnetospirillum magneticum]|uniref:hypothetical protein n=1 Tax=Paramagnetospirillum magneticum TaxID=84159 RepID=UPI000314B6AF|nr:hypothetical protein [Paramagnetospirillum magneticum]
MSADDVTVISDDEVDELVAMERQIAADAAEKEEIRAAARREAEQRKVEAERQERRNTLGNAAPYRRPSSLPGGGLDLIRKGLGHA